MRRQELIHVHALLLEVRVFLEATDAISADRFAPYDAQSVRPHDIYRGKNAHRHAIDLLLDGFEREAPLSERPPIQ